METIEIKTLIDITNTNKARLLNGQQFEHNQFKNWTTLLQCLGLRAIIHYDNNSTVENIDIKELGFGKAYKGKHNVWTFKFTTDRVNVYLQDDNPVGFLEQDLDNVPVIGNLTETINIAKAVFLIHDQQFKNTLITAHQGSIYGDET